MTDFVLTLTFTLLISIREQRDKQGYTNIGDKCF